MHYQHPELEIVRAALDYHAPIDTTEAKGATERLAAHFMSPLKPITLVSGWEPRRLGV
jgi:hypothetical protein